VTTLRRVVDKENLNASFFSEVEWAKVQFINLKAFFVCDEPFKIDRHCLDWYNVADDFMAAFHLNYSGEQAGDLRAITHSHFGGLLIRDGNFAGFYREILKFMRQLDFALHEAIIF